MKLKAALLLMTACMSCAKGTSGLKDDQSDSEQSGIDQAVLSAAFDAAVKVRETLGDEAVISVGKAVLRQLAGAQPKIVISVRTVAGDIIKTSKLFEIQQRALPHGMWQYYVDVKDGHYQPQDGDIAISKEAQDGVDALLHASSAIDRFRYNAGGLFVLTSFKSTSQSRDVTRFTYDFRIISQSNPIGGGHKVLTIDRIREVSTDPMASYQYKYVALVPST
jgi:hypothetical protein